MFFTAKPFKRASFFLLARFLFLLPKFFFKKSVIFLCQNFGISKKCYIFVIQSNTNINQLNNIFTMKTLIKAVAENTGYLFYAVVIAGIILRIVEKIVNFLF